MSTLDEQFATWMLRGRLSQPRDSGPYSQSDLRDAFLAGAEAGAKAEREGVLENINEITSITSSYGGGHLWDSCNMMTELERRIRERGESK